MGRSRPFWRHSLPRLREAFPDALGDAALAPFYRAINRVEPSLIRVEADEVTYNLHVMLRFELERGLIDGTVSVNDLPARWNEAMDEYLGVVPDTDGSWRPLIFSSAPPGRRFQRRPGSGMLVASSGSYTSCGADSDGRRRSSTTDGISTSNKERLRG